MAYLLQVFMNKFSSTLASTYTQTKLLQAKVLLKQLKIQRYTYVWHINLLNIVHYVVATAVPYTFHA